LHTIYVKFKFYFNLERDEIAQIFKKLTLIERK